MKTNVRHNCLEVPLSDAEKSRIDAHCVAVGLARSVFARFTMLQAIEADVTASAPLAESLPCRDAPIASRSWNGIAGVRQRHRHVALPGRSDFGPRARRQLL